MTQKTQAAPLTDWFAEREPTTPRERMVWQSGWQQGYAAGKARQVCCQGKEDCGEVCHPAASAQPLVGEREALEREFLKIEELAAAVDRASDAHGEPAWYDEHAPNETIIHIDKAGIARADGEFIEYLSPTRVRALIKTTRAILASKQPAAASEREWWKAIRVACSRGHAWIARGVRWQDQLTLTEWEVVEPTGTAIYSPSGLGGTLCFWCKPINGAVPEGWAKDARPDGCVSFCGDSIAAAVLVAGVPSVGET